MMRRSVVVMFCALTLLACRQTERAPTPSVPALTQTVTLATTSTALPADALAGHRFVSVEEREVGLGPDGAEMGHWTLDFGPDTVIWLYSDIAERGPYVLQPDGTIMAQLGPEGAIEATYDATRDRVRWDGMWYERGLRGEE